MASEEPTVSVAVGQRNWLPGRPALDFMATASPQDLHLELALVQILFPVVPVLFWQEAAQEVLAVAAAAGHHAAVVVAAEDTVVVEEVAAAADRILLKSSPTPF